MAAAELRRHIFAVVLGDRRGARASGRKGARMPRAHSVPAGDLTRSDVSIRSGTALGLFRWVHRGERADEDEALQRFSGRNFPTPVAGMARAPPAR
jgi:hypothetical protein